MGINAGFSVREFLMGCGQTESQVLQLYPKYFECADAIHAHYTELVSHHHTEPAACKILATSAHQYFLSALRVSVAGLVPAVFPIARATLESALYAHSIHANPESAPIWVQRDANDGSLETFKKTFTARKVLMQLKAAHPELGKEVSWWYETTIRHGAHPNQEGSLPHLDISETSFGEPIVVLPMIYSYPPQASYIRNTLFASIRTGGLALKILTDVFDSDPFALVARGVADQVAIELAALVKSEG